MSGNLEAALATFATASAYIESVGSAREVEWQANRRFLEFNESDLLREAAWVVLCTGFRETVVRKVFDHISLSFCDWESSASIVAAASTCRSVAMASFRNRRKLDAIIMIAQLVNDVGFDLLKSRILVDPIRELNMLPYIGPVTAWHLAKNLGVEVAKPDRHLVRLCEELGFADVHELCGTVATATGRAIGVVDFIFWRYLAASNTRRRRHAFSDN